MQTFHGHETFGHRYQVIGNRMKLALRMGGFIPSIPCGRDSDARSSQIFAPPSGFFPPPPASSRASPPPPLPLSPATRGPGGAASG